MSENKKDAFKEITASMEWKDIEGLISALDDSDYWTDEFYQKSEREAKAHHIRKMMRSFKDEEGFPQFASVEVNLPDGRTSRVYKQLDLFERDDFGQARRYCVGKIRRYKYLYDGYTEREKRRFGSQLVLLYPEAADLQTTV
jgi:t-SNARE complex subunit (syntaxin)